MMIRVIICLLVVCSCALGRPIGLSVASDIEVLEGILCKINQRSKVEPEDFVTISHYLKHDHKLLVALASTCVEFMGTDGRVFAKDLNELKGSKIHYINAHVILALNAIEVGEQSKQVKIDRLLALFDRENEYLRLQIVIRLYEANALVEYADDVLDEILEKSEYSTLAYATKIAWLYDKKRGLEPRVSMPIPAETASKSKLAKVVLASGGYGNSSYFISGSLSVDESSTYEHERNFADVRKNEREGLYLGGSAERTDATVKENSESIRKGKSILYYMFLAFFVLFAISFLIRIRRSR